VIWRMTLSEPNFLMLFAFYETIQTLSLWSVTLLAPSHHVSGNQSIILFAIEFLSNLVCKTPFDGEIPLRTVGPAKINYTIAAVRPYNLHRR
jgi:hypothetical protein